MKILYLIVRPWYSSQNRSLTAKPILLWKLINFIFKNHFLICCQFSYFLNNYSILFNPCWLLLRFFRQKEVLPDSAGFTQFDVQDCLNQQQAREKMGKKILSYYYVIEYLFDPKHISCFAIFLVDPIFFKLYFVYGFATEFYLHL